MALSTCGFGRSRVMKSVHPRGVHSCWRGAVCLLPGCRNLFAQLRIPNYAKELHDLFATDLSSFPDALKGAQVVVLAQLNCQRRHLVGPCINSSESLSSFYHLFRDFIDLGPKAWLPGQQPAAVENLLGPAAIDQKSSTTHCRVGLSVAVTSASQVICQSKPAAEIGGVAWELVCGHVDYVAILCRYCMIFNIVCYFFWGFVAKSES